MPPTIAAARICADTGIQIYSRALASGRDRASVFAWAVVDVMYHGNDDDDGFVHRSSDADAFSISFQREIFDCGRLVIESVQLLSDVLFSDTHPQDCADIDWSTVSISSSCCGETAAAAACEALLMIMDAVAWSHGTVLTTGSKHPEAIAGVNFDGSSWAKSTSYRRVLICNPWAAALFAKYRLHPDTFCQQMRMLGHCPGFALRIFVQIYVYISFINCDVTHVHSHWSQSTRSCTGAPAAVLLLSSVWQPQRYQSGAVFRTGTQRTFP